MARRTTTPTPAGQEPNSIHTTVSNDELAALERAALILGIRGVGAFLRTAGLEKALALGVRVGEAQ